MKTDKLTARGIFTLKVYKKGKLIEKYRYKNLIVTVGKTSFAHLIAGDGAGKEITKIGFGEGSVAPAAGDTALTSAYTKALDGQTYPTATSVKFDFNLGTAEANGKAITEFGLLSDDGTLCARRTRSVINKTVDISLTGTWEIIF